MSARGIGEMDEEMPTETREIEEEASDQVTDDRGDENRFSQDDNDIAGTSWHGMNSEIEPEELGYVEENLEGDEVLLRAGVVERV